MGMLWCSRKQSGKTENSILPSSKSRQAWSPVRFHSLHTDLARLRRSCVGFWKSQSGLSSALPSTRKRTGIYCKPLCRSISIVAFPPISSFILPWLHLWWVWAITWHLTYMQIHSAKLRWNRSPYPGINLLPASLRFFTSLALPTPRKRFIFSSK